MSQTSKIKLKKKILRPYNLISPAQVAIVFWKGCKRFRVNDYPILTKTFKTENSMAPIIRTNWVSDSLNPIKDN